MTSTIARTEAQPMAAPSTSIPSQEDHVTAAREGAAAKIQPSGDVGELASELERIADNLLLIVEMKVSYPSLIEIAQRIKKAAAELTRLQAECFEFRAVNAAVNRLLDVNHKKLCRFQAECEKWEALAKTHASNFALARMETAAAERKGIERAAEVANKHKGDAAKRRKAKGFRLSELSPEAQAEITAEERGEDIAAEIIERTILALNVGEI